MSKLLVVAFGLSALLALAAPAPAQTAGVGFRGGLSVNPDQFYLGGHLDAGPLVERLWLRPSLELGLGDNLTLIALNAEVAWWFPGRGRWRFYAGGGPALNVYDFEGPGDSDLQAGLNFVVGVAHRRGFFVEAKAGAFDSPDFKLGLGYTFR